MKSAYPIICKGYGGAERRIPLANLDDRVMDFIRQKPFFFNDILRHFATEEYRDLLVAWAAIRSMEKFQRDEDGKYILVKK
jgi:hypothetical protein